MDPNCITLTYDKTTFVNLAEARDDAGNPYLSEADLNRIYNPEPPKPPFNGELLLPVYKTWGIDHITVGDVEPFFANLTVWYKTEVGVEDKAEIFRIPAPNVVVARQVPVNGYLQTQFRVVEQLRHAVGRYTLEFPGGMVNRGKSLTGVGAKEVREETGLEIPGDRFVMLGECNRDGARSVNLTAAVLVIVVPWDTPDQDIIKEQGEHIRRTFWMSVEDIEAYFRTTKVMDGAFATACTYLQYQMPDLWNSRRVEAFV
jgi:8-oxo-dGTP pyrophosphatase MutT (NUDIX family)